MIEVNTRVAVSSVGAGLALFTELLPLDFAAVERMVERELDANPWLERRETSIADRIPHPDPAQMQESLFAHLERQLLARSGISRDLRRAAVHLAGELDEHGYLRVPLLELAQRLRVEVGVVERALELVQRLEPSGVAARDLGERFRLQLRESDADDADARLVTHHLEELARVGKRAFARAHELRDADLDRALDALRRCDPHPARDFGERSHPVAPELLFERGDAGFSVRVASHLADVQLMPMTCDRGCSSTFRAARRRALIFLDALDRRAKTLQRLGETLLALQHAYFLRDGDAAALVPLSGRMLAREMHCSPSTVSRALVNRYARTPFGTIDLRSFVVRRAGTTGLSVARAIDAVKRVFDDVPTATDAEAARLLRLRGIRLARRTVAKYRCIGGVPSARDRSA